MALEEKDELEDKVVDTNEDDLDSWYDEVDQSADEETDDNEEASTPESEEEESPDHKVQNEAAEEAADTGTTPESKPTEDPYQWMVSLDEGLKKRVEALVHSDQSNRGRVAALQSRLDKQQAELEAKARVAASPAAQKAVESGKAIEDMDDDELREFMEEFPSVARNVQKLVARESEKVLGQVRPIQEEALRNRLTQQKETLRANAHHIFNTAETGVELEDVLGSPRFKEWIVQQPPGYRKFAQSAESVEDATKVLVDFAQYTDEMVYRQWEAEQATQPAAAPADTPKGSRRKADETSARRKAALSGTGPKSRSAEYSDSGDADDYESYFNQAVENG